MAIRRARVIKGANKKKFLPAKILSENFQQHQKWIVYCDDNNQLNDVKADMQLNGFDSLEYHYQMESPQEKVLEKFRELGGVLLSINCLDEGVDIPELSHAIVLASSQNPRQFIQRRGRVLRKSQEKIFADIYDGIVIPGKISNE